MIFRTKNEEILIFFKNGGAGEKSFEKSQFLYIIMLYM